MRTFIRSLVLCSTLILLAEPLPGTVIRPTYVPGLSMANSAGASTPERMVDNSGMIPAIWTGTSRADTLAAKHVFNPLTDASWLTNDPPPAGGPYFGGTAADPVLVFDLGRDHLITELFFWQLQRNMPPDSWAKDITVGFAADPAGGSPPDFSLITGISRTLAPAPLPPPVPWTNDVQNFLVPGSKVARFIKLTVTDNRGGPRVGLGEFRVKIGDGPLVGPVELVELPALTVINANQGPTIYQVPIHNLGLAPFVINTLTFNPDTGRFRSLVPLSFSVAPGTTYLMIEDTTGGPDFVIAEGTLETGSGTRYSLAMGGPPSSDVPICYSEDRTIGPYPKGIGAQSFEFYVKNEIDLMTKAYADLNIYGLSAVGPFVTISSEASFPKQVSPKTTVTFNARFDPGDDPRLVLTDSIVIASDDPSNPDGNTTVAVEATILNDLEISTPPVVTIPPTGGSSTAITLKNTGMRGYSLGGAPTISGGGGFSVLSYPMDGIGTDDLIVIQSEGAIIGIYVLTVAVSLNDSSGHVSDFVIRLTVKVRDPVELTAHGFEPDGFKVSISNLLPGEKFHLRSSTDLINWEPIGDSVTADDDQMDQWLPVDRATQPTLFFRWFEGEKPVGGAGP